MRHAQWGMMLCGFAAMALAALAGCLQLDSHNNAGAGIVVSLVADPAPGAPAAHGMAELTRALEARGDTVQRVASVRQATGAMVVVAGLGTNGPAADLSRAWALTIPTQSEGLLIGRGKTTGAAGQLPAILLAGADDRGLMYAELDVADRIGWAKDPRRPFSEVREVSETPASPQRAVTIYTMQRAYFESRLYDDHYWDKYFDLMAKDRLNDLFLIFGYENGGFLAPCYPYFFDVDGYSDVRMVGLTKEQQTKNRDALNRLIQKAHDHGIMVTIGIWDHIYRGGVQANGVPGSDVALRQPTPGWVWGVTQDNLMAYTKAALSKFLKVFPSVDGIQFRMHDESGLRENEQAAFWKDAFALLHQQAPALRIDIRAKGLPDSTIEDAIDAGINMRVSTKFWMEQMGLPFHPTHINTQDQQNRRHSYADLLHYPVQYPVAWGLWNGGTARILLWADPDYARRFVESTHIFPGAGDGGFEFDEPLGMKMNGQGMDVKPFDLMPAEHRYYEYEFERYWHLFQIFGRIGYNPATPSEVWDHEFNSRFGESAGPYVEKGVHEASEVLPRIVAACYPYSAFPMTRGWAEKQTLGTLPKYAAAQGSDIAQFESFDEEAQNFIEGRATAKVRPQETSRYLHQVSLDVLKDRAEARKRIGGHGSKEFQSTMVDLQMLADLAEFHARRIPAAVEFCMYKRTGDRDLLDHAIAHEREAVAAWKDMAAAAGDFYTDNLMMGAPSSDLTGHWRDEIPGLEKGIADLPQERASANANLPLNHQQLEAEWEMTYWLAPVLPTVEHRGVTTAVAGKPLVIVATVKAPDGIKSVRVRYRAVNQMLDYQSLEMQATGNPNEYRAVIPGDQITAKYDMMYYIEAVDKKGDGRIYPDLEKETPYVVVHLQR